MIKETVRLRKKMSRTVSLFAGVSSDANIVNILTFSISEHKYKLLSNFSQFMVILPNRKNYEKKTPVWMSFLNIFLRDG